ncbi:hypothetical protein [Arthrobacter sp. U41]|uniref:hypothetical protein n=1 Tax=Arthrobacter sp. U41 TaxID=1849032 RepID=UPI0008596B3A|nr:hypothetical protein [Arthrobacter sp. U41]AOT04201.1 hypothetical protein ASPU41_13555 [Arthrobacter sp. U41]
MDSKADTAARSGVPAVLTTCSWIWLVLGAAGTVWTLQGLLLVLAFSGMVPPQTYLPALVLYLASAAVFVTGGVFAVLLRRGRRLARIVLSAYALIIPALFIFRGGPPVGEVPWPAVLLSPVGAAGAAAVAVTVLMWLPAANAYFAAAGAHKSETAAAPELASDRVPTAVTASVWILVVGGVLAALQAALGLLLLADTMGSGGSTTPALVLWLTLASVAVADLACAGALRRGRAFVRPVVTVIPVAGLTLLVLATLAGLSSAAAGSPAATGGVLPAVFLTVFSQGLPLIGGLVPAVLLWLPSARRHFRRGAVVHPAGTAGP